MKKPTAVDFLREKLDKYIMWNEGHHQAEEYTLSNLSDDFEQARQMERQQIIDAVDDPKYMESHKTPSTIPGIDSHSMGWFMNGRQYYEINYGGKQ